MKIHRAASGEHASLPAALLQDGRLSYRARGILAELLSRPDGWIESVDDLVQMIQQQRDGAAREGRANLRAALAELEECGYILRTQRRERGRFVATFDVFAEPNEPSLEHDAVKLSFRRRTWLYRHWDESGRLLYVGVTETFPSRQRMHENTSRWMPLVAQVTKEPFSSREEAERAEMLAIATEKPIFNVLGNETGAARQRLVGYLRERDRLDLIAPSGDAVRADGVRRWTA